MTYPFVLQAGETEHRVNDRNYVKFMDVMVLLYLLVGCTTVLWDMKLWDITQE